MAFSLTWRTHERGEGEVVGEERRGVSEYVSKGLEERKEGKVAKRNRK